MPVRLQPAAPRSRVKHSTTEPMRSLPPHEDHGHIVSDRSVSAWVKVQKF